MKEQTDEPRLLSEELSEYMRVAFGAAFPEAGDGVASVSVVTAANPEFGDFQCNDALSLAKVLKKPPRAVAQSVVERLAEREVLERVEVAGPGFINLTLNSGWLADRLGRMSGTETLGTPAVGRGKTVLVDYSSPNMSKPMHIGHIRSINIGNAIDRMFRFLGYRVIADNHIGDWGTQFGIIIMGYRHFLNPAAMKEEPVEELERVYVRSYEKAQQDDAWMNQCRQELVKLQSGDAENLALWREFMRLSLEEFDHIYKRLGVSFDLARGESYYNDRLQGLVGLLFERGLATISEGATVVLLDDVKLPLCIVRKSDGGFNYATTDLATVASRVEEFHPDRIVYVTDERQQLHFRQFFAICRKLGYGVQLDHVWFGLMRLPEGTFSTRQGNVIKLDRLLDEAEARALRIVQESSPQMPAERQREVARTVGIGAVKYADLSQNPQTLVTFTWEKALALDGNSAPYLQYAYARICSVRDKYKEQFPATDPDAVPLQFSAPVERALAVKLAQFPEIVIRAAHGYKPSVVTDYLYDLSQTYSSFYQNVPFLKAPEGVRESRVRLCGIVAKVLRTGLSLLGIETPERI